MKTSWPETIAQGLVAGVIGCLTVIVVFVVANLFTGHSPMYTSAVLGATLFYGVTDPAQVVVTPQYVLAYTGFHLVVFLVFGVIASSLARLADVGEQLWFVALFFLIFIAFHLFGVVQAFATPMQSALSDGAIWGAGIAASVAMGAYLLWAHPGMRRRQAW